jgi:hypothetical protein
MSSHDTQRDLNLKFELAVLRGPAPLAGNEVKFGVVGDHEKRITRFEKAVLALFCAMLAGAGGAFAWAYAAGQEKANAQRDVQQLRQELEELKAKLSRRDSGGQNSTRVTDHP